MPSAAHLAAIEQKGDQLTLPFTGKAIVCKKKKNLEVPALPGQLRARNSAEGATLSQGSTYLQEEGYI